MAKRGTKGRRVGRPTGERGNETEIEILDAAEHVFAAVGYSGARVQAIADEAGVTKAMIHYYFDTKEKLFRAVLDRILFELIKLVQEVSSSGRPRVERLDTFVRGFFDYVSRHPHFGRLTFFVAGGRDRYFDNIVTEFFGPLFKRGLRFIDKGVKEGVFQPVDARHLLLSIYSVTMGYLADARFISLLQQDDAMSQNNLDACRDALLRMVFATLGAEPPNPL